MRFVFPSKISESTGSESKHRGHLVHAAAQCFLPPYLRHAEAPWETFLLRVFKANTDQEGRRKTAEKDEARHLQQSTFLAYQLPGYFVLEYFQTFCILLHVEENEKRQSFFCQFLWKQVFSENQCCFPRGTSVDSIRVTNSYKQSEKKDLTVKNNET